jgi:hypothetical protein
MNGRSLGKLKEYVGKRRAQRDSGRELRKLMMTERKGTKKVMELTLLTA